MIINYLPFSKVGYGPADKRRALLWLEKRKIEWISSLNRQEEFDILIYPNNSDLIKINNLKNESKLVMQIVDGYLVGKESLPKILGKGIIKFLSGELSRPVFYYNKLLKKSMRTADLIICASSEQMQVLKKINSRIEVIPDNHSIYFFPREEINLPKKIILLWEGLGPSLKHLGVLRTMLNQLEAEGIEWELNILTDLIYKKITNKYYTVYANKEISKSLVSFMHKINIHQWTEESLLSFRNTGAIGLIPISPEDKFARTKHESKLSLFWNLGIPTLMSPIPSYQRVCENAGLQDEIVWNEDQWYSKLIWLTNKENYFSARNLQDKYVLENFTLTKYLEKWDKVINTLM